ncbi:hypothetical protein G7062_04255 [Erysipelothrix sp. HDW6C]|uniref:DUF6895 family protein n=1 Tax=Erysipelothrix sp. HDW6C TaxID=2714930 RepID=UPI001408557A|nr:hypothetical protein [Erysipelothrix sp. HDW6C]QIK69555.1 hypothetical protein G7062_04255 [Erysipelothrix sp. HDW6C]
MNTIEIARRINKLSLDWIIKNLADFSLESQYFSQEKDSQLKMVAELCFVMLPALNSNVNNGQTGPILNQIQKTITTINFQSIFEENINRIATIGIINVFAYKLRDKHIIDMDFVRNHDLVQKLDNLPFRKMDLKFILELSDVEVALGYYDLYMETTLGNMQPPHTLTFMDMYSVTHTVFYITKLSRGIKEKRILPQQEKIHRYLMVLLIMCRKEKNFDLLFEIIYAITLVDYQMDAMDRLSIQESLKYSYERVQKIGYFESYEGMNKYVDTQVKAFELTYHTVLVAFGMSQELLRVEL